MGDQSTLLRKRRVTEAGCWEWTGSRRPGRASSVGYGQMRFEGRNYFTHRLAYQLWVGPIPDGLTIDHLCRNTLCFNPAHLEAVTIQETSDAVPGPTRLTALKGIRT